MTEIADTLCERGSRYGNFADQGRIEQNIKRAFADSPNWATLPDDSRSGLEMIATKISRILKGDPEYHDSWHDIIGYAKLVADRIASPCTHPGPLLAGADEVICLKCKAQIG